MTAARAQAGDIEHFVAGLIALFDDRAIEIAARQVQQAAGSALVSWSEIVEALSRKQSIQ